MICRKCNSEVEEGLVYCPKCGSELHYVPDYDEIDEELDRSMRLLTNDVANNTTSENTALEVGADRQQLERDLEKPETRPKQDTRKLETKKPVEKIPQKSPEKPKDKPRDPEPESEPVSEEWEEFRLVKELTPQQKKRRMIAKIVGMSCLIALLIVGIVAFGVVRSHNNSFRVQFKNGEKYALAGDFSKTVISYENAINSADGEEDTAKAAKALGLYYADNSDTKNAVFYLEMAVDNGCLDTDVITTLVHLYELQGNSDSIKKLARVASSDETYSLFEKYLLNQPIFNYKSGTYNEYLTVEITSDANERIHYTTDDSPATPESPVYEGPFEVKDGTTVIHAITVNENNLVSEEIVTTYVVQSVGGAKPVIYPESGEYNDFTKITIDDVSANCKIYYTIDGTEPNENSLEYVEPFEMPVGNHVVKAVSINTQTKTSSEVVSKIYDLDVSEKYDTSKAVQLVMGKLEEKGDVVNLSGAMEDGSCCVLQFDEEVTIDSKKYYVMHRYQMTGGQNYDTGILYGVDLASGNVFLMQKVKDGIYNLDVF